MQRIIVLAFPVFALLIALEFCFGLYTRRNTYRLNDAINSLSLGLISRLASIFLQFFEIGLYTLCYSYLNLFPKAPLWDTWAGWVLAVILYDFFDYWLHRTSHESAFFWGAHVVHHQSQDFNFSTALRQESFYDACGWMFFIPMALLGVPPENFAVAGLVVLIYQFWIHTEHVGKLGWLDRVLSTPSNHRVHHAVNPQYMNKNYAAIFIVWDRLFGTFAEEKEKCIYGALPPLNSWDPLKAVGSTWGQLFKDAWATPRWSDKLRILFKQPGWRPVTDRPMRLPDVQKIRRYNPVISGQAKWFAGVHFPLMLGATAVYLWYCDILPRLPAFLLMLTICCGLWSIGAVLDGKLPVRRGWLLQLLAAAVAGGIYLSL